MYICSKYQQSNTKIMKIKYSFCYVVFSLLVSNFSVFGQPLNQEECTIGVTLGTVTVDGRPLLWKTRDNSGSPDNEVIYNTSYKYKFICVSTAGSTLSWMGVNEHGFSIVNSASTDLATNLFGPGDGTLMRSVLGNCKTVSEFQEYLDSTNNTGRSTQSNFGVIDSTGAAAIFETGGNVYHKFDANSTTNGYIIRTNFSVNGGGSAGIERYNRSTNLINSFYNGDTLNYKSIIRYQMRDFSDNNSNPVSVPYAANWTSGTPYGYINSDKSICRSSSVSTAVIHGVLPTEFAGLTTMWTILGQPASTISLPYWPVGNTPIEADGVSTAELCDKAREIEALLFDYSANGYCIDSYKLRNSSGYGLWSCLFPLEDYLFSETQHYLDSLRLLNALPINSMINKEANYASYVLSQLQNCKNSIVDIDVIESTQLIKVFPNPAVDKLYIDCSEVQNVKMQIFNVIGEFIMKREFNSNMNEINISSLPKGIYIIQIIGDNIAMQSKLIKE